MPGALAIETANLQKSYGPTPALIGVNLRVEAGTIFGLCGPRGSGKTSLVRILSTDLAPDAGRVLVAGYDVVRQTQMARRNINRSGQPEAIDDRKTVSENLRAIARRSGFSRIGAQRRAAELLSQLDLIDVADRSLATLSAGMRRGLEIAARLISLPAVLLLDEPTAGLDAQNRREVWERLRRITGDGTTILFTTPSIAEASELADRVAMIDQGQIVADDAPWKLERLTTCVRREPIATKDAA
jgi:ABC-type multidrug transport system ATPase subunit